MIEKRYNRIYLYTSYGYYEWDPVDGFIYQKMRDVAIDNDCFGWLPFQVRGGLPYPKIGTPEDHIIYACRTHYDSQISTLINLGWQPPNEPLLLERETHHLQSLHDGKAEVRFNTGCGEVWYLYDGDFCMDVDIEVDLTYNQFDRPVYRKLTEAELQEYMNDERNWQWAIGRSLKK